MTPAIKTLTLEQQSGFYRSTLHLVNMLYSRPMTKPEFLTEACRFLMLPLTARPDLKINHAVMNLAFSKHALPRSEIFGVMQRNGLLVPKIQLSEPSCKDLVSLNAAQEMGIMSKYIEQNQKLSNIHVMPADTTKLLTSPGFSYLYPGLRRMAGQKDFDGVYQLDNTPAVKCLYAFDVKSGSMDLSFTKMHLYHLFLYRGKEQVPPLLSPAFDLKFIRKCFRSYPS